MHTSSSNILVTVFAGAAALYFLRDALTPLAMAILLWFAIDALAHALSSRFRLLPVSFALPIAIGLAFAAVAAVAALVIRNVSELTVNVGAHESRLDLLLAEMLRLAHINGQPPTVGQLVSQIDFRPFVSAMAAAAQSLTAQTALTLVYLVFMFPAAASSPQKLDRIFPLASDRE